MSMKQKLSLFKFKPFSEKQLKVLAWWNDSSPVKDKNGIIADGAIRSGKSLTMSLSFVMWAMATFDSNNFAMCGKTIGSFRRNVLFWLKLMLRSRGYTVTENRADNYIEIRRKGVVNYFYIFGGKDERSQDLIQGITLAGIFFDEVVLMPESFVNQAIGRLSVDGSKMWFNGNPGNPTHYFYVEWILKREERGLIYLHFTQEDNLSLSEKIKARYRSMYSGVFYQRYIEGEWIRADGLIYSMYDPEVHNIKSSELQDMRKYRQLIISCDYGTQNPFVLSLWGEYNGAWYLLKEYYHSGKKTREQLTDEEYYQELLKFAKDLEIKFIIIDPSAASFITLIKKKGKFMVKKADNAVADGIRECATALKLGLVKFNEDCNDSLSEFGEYIWNAKSADRGIDEPVKDQDHFMDSFRYFVKTMKITHPKFKRLGS